MKTKKTFSLMIVTTLLFLGIIGCSNDIDEVPPRTNNVTKTYVLPKETRLAPEERDYIEQRLNEYEEAIKE